jgi:hypothetical protein
MNHHRTTRLVEQQKTLASAGKRKPRGKPFEKGNKVGNRFKPGESGNPSGLPGTDLAAVYARRFFGSHPEGISKAMAEDLEGFDAYAFGVVADRGYGKVASKIGAEAKGDIVMKVIHIGGN